MENIDTELALLKKDVEIINKKVSNIEWWGRWGVLLVAGYVITQILDSTFAETLLN